MSKMPKAPRGGRPLEIGEIIQAGDVCWFRSRWEPCGKSEIGRPQESGSFRRARPLVQPAATCQSKVMRRLKPLSLVKIETPLHAKARSRYEAARKRGTI